MIAQFRVLALLPDVPESDLRIGKEILNATHPGCVHTASLQPPHQPLCRLAPGPGANQSIELLPVLFSLLKRGKARVRQPLGDVRRVTQTLPFLIVPAANHAPLTIAAWITTMWRGRTIPIAVAVCDDAVC